MCVTPRLSTITMTCVMPFDVTRLPVTVTFPLRRMLVESMLRAPPTTDNEPLLVASAFSTVNNWVVMLLDDTEGNTAVPVTDSVPTVAFAIKALLFTCKNSKEISLARDILFTITRQTFFVVLLKSFLNKQNDFYNSKLFIPFSKK